ncbi:MAG TPA: peptide chain release factor N(5)-glutamine methyltransferase [Dehalococcoidia bacterium]|nr:peptide chain release factor N(5)-glutamine methyltransferase [Dehalococcoidia bacterium]
MTIAGALRHAAARLSQAGIDDARLEAEVLLAHALGVDRRSVLASLREALSSHACARFDLRLARRLSREPLAYIVGRREFFGIDIICAPGALIPRPETELLVELVLRELHRRGGALRIADVGTGSGAIAVAVALNVPAAQIIAIDRSSDALAVARRNVAQYALASRIHLVQADLLDSVGTCDVVLANLPYVDEAEWSSLAPEIRDYEPRLALDGAAGGVAVIARVLAQAPAHLAPGGLLALEIGDMQASALHAEACAAFPAGRSCVIKDLAGRDRVLAVRAAR